MEGEYLDPCFPLIDMQLKDEINIRSKEFIYRMKFFCTNLSVSFYAQLVVYHISYFFKILNFSYYIMKRKL